MCVLTNSSVADLTVAPMIGEAVAEQRPVEAAVKEPVGIPEGSFASGKPLRAHGLRERRKSESFYLKASIAPRPQDCRAARTRRDEVPRSLHPRRIVLVMAAFSPG